MDFLYSYRFFIRCNLNITSRLNNTVFGQGAPIGNPKNSMLLHKWVLDKNIRGRLSCSIPPPRSGPGGGSIGASMKVGPWQKRSYPNPATKLQSVRTMTKRFRTVCQAWESFVLSLLSLQCRGIVSRSFRF